MSSLLTIFQRIFSGGKEEQSPPTTSFRPNNNSNTNTDSSSFQSLSNHSSSSSTSSSSSSSLNSTLNTPSLSSKSSSFSFLNVTPTNYSIPSSSKPSSNVNAPTNCSIPSTNYSIPSSSKPSSSNVNEPTNYYIPSSKPSYFLNPSSVQNFSSNNYVKVQPYEKDVDIIIKEKMVTDSSNNLCSNQQRKDLKEFTKETITSSDSKKPKSPSIASQIATPKKAKQRYEIPKHLEKQIMKVLQQPLSPSTYSEYFGALLDAEDYYIERWSEFILSDVALKLKKREPFEKISRENKNTNERTLLKKKPFVAFEINNIHERRPYLLSRDFVLARVSTCKTAEPFKGTIFRVVKSTTVLAEFGDDFHLQHSSLKKYDVSFSFNRVCLKRAHQAVKAGNDSSFHDILFPNLNSTSNAIHLFRNYDHTQLSISNRISNHKGPLPYLIEGPPSIKSLNQLSKTGTVIQESIVKICMTFSNCRILICSPSIQSCDVLMQSLHEEIPKEKLFGANAAFREYDHVPDDIITQNLYGDECFTCPSLNVLQNYNVITCTFVSSYRLRVAGLSAEHFTHIFLIDASSAMEPEVVVPLANFIGKNMIVVVMGSVRYSGPSWARSGIGRRYGLERSYFQRLIKKEPYSSRDPVFISHLE